VQAQLFMPSLKSYGMKQGTSYNMVQRKRRPLTEDSLREIDGAFELRCGGKAKGRITVALKWVQVLSHVVAVQTANRNATQSCTQAITQQPLDASEMEHAAVLELCLSSMNVKVAFSFFSFSYLFVSFCSFLHAPHGAHLIIYWGAAPTTRLLQEEVLQPGDRVYAAFQFLSSPESVTQSIFPPATCVNYTMRAKVDVDDRLYAYMHTTRLEIRVHRLSGFHHQLIGRSFVPLCEVLETFATTAGVLRPAAACRQEGTCEHRRSDHRVAYFF
jgi:hypothetical protein